MASLRKSPPSAPLSAGLRRFVRWVVLFLVLSVGALLLVGSPARDMLRGLLDDPGSSGIPATSGPVRDERYVWRPVAIGGGGFITGLAMDGRGRTFVARSDVYGAYRWDEPSDRWVQLVTAESMPPAYRIQSGAAEGVYALAVAPGDARRVYMAMAGQVFRSDDAGATWTQSRGAPFPVTFNANSKFRTYGPFLAVSPSDPDLVFFGTPEAGLLRSLDGGVSWQRIATIPASADLRRDQGHQAPGHGIWFNEGKRGAERILVASPGHGLFEGAARGSAFTRLGGAEGGPTSVKRIGIAPDGTIYAADPESRSLWRYGRGGWRNLTSETPVPEASWSDVVVVDKGRTVLAVDDGGRFWCSADGGGDWAKVERSFLPGSGEPPWLRILNRNYFAVGQLTRDPAVPNRLWAATGAGVYVADLDPGCDRVDFRSQVRGIEEIVANDVIHPPGQAPLFAGWDFGIHVKRDLDSFSTTYGPRPRVLIAAQQLDWSPANPRFVVTNASDTLMGCCFEDGDSILAGFSMDGGESWQKFASLPHPPGTDDNDPWRMSFGTIAVAADNAETIVWAPAFNRSPYVTHDRGQSWTRVSLPGERLPDTGSFSAFYPQRKTLAADRVLPGTFYLVHSGDGANAALQGLWRSSDHGRIWNQVFMGEIAPASPWAAKLRAVPGHAGHLFFTSGVRMKGDTVLRHSRDGGVTWQQVRGVDQVDDIGFGRAAADSDYPTIFVAGRVNGAFGIWRSVDQATTWQRVAGFPLRRLDQVTVVAGDPDRFGRVYLGFKGSGWVYGMPAPCQSRGSDASAGECVAVEAAK